MSNPENERFVQSRYEEYLDEGYNEEEASLMTQLDLEEAGDLAPDVY